MPTYDFQDIHTGDILTKKMTFSEKCTYLHDHEHMKSIVLQAPSTVSGTGTVLKTSNGWNDNLSRIADANPGSKLADTYGKKDPTSVKVRDATKRYKETL